MHVGIFGLAGAGKTTLASLLASRCEFYTAVSASKLIKDFGGVVEYERLRRGEVLLNQDKLVVAYEEFKKLHKNTLIELHALIESEQGVVEIDASVLRRLDLDLAVFIFVEPRELVRRRLRDLKKIRKRVDAHEIALLQARAIEICRTALGEKLRIVKDKNALLAVERMIDSF